VFTTEPPSGGGGGAPEVKSDNRRNLNPSKELSADTPQMDHSAPKRWGVVVKCWRVTGCEHAPHRRYNDHLRTDINTYRGNGSASEVAGGPSYPLLVGTECGAPFRPLRWVVCNISPCYI
jgi:hypothetical protein